MSRSPMPLGYRADDLPLHELGTVEAIRLTRHVLELEELSRTRRNVDMHLYVLALKQGKNPRIRADDKLEISE